MLTSIGDFPGEFLFAQDKVVFESNGNLISVAIDGSTPAIQLSEDLVLGGHVIEYAVVDTIVVYLADQDDNNEFNL